jgi:cysteine desulfurase/selenocysteine lyase
MSLPLLKPGHNSYDVEAIRADFPVLQRPVYGRPLVYLDSAASAQKPRQVIEAMTRAMAEDYSNIHRGVHALSQRISQQYEDVRGKVAAFINAASPNEIVFTRNSTEAINLVAASWGRKFLRDGDEIVLTELEHHANIVPWQLLQAEKNIVIKVAPILDDGSLDLAAFTALLGPKTKLVAAVHVSNALGTILPVKEMARLAHAAGALMLVDGSQSVVHMPVDVRDLDCDFFVFTGHKLYGPTGIGVLYGKYALLDAMPPYQGGGDMIETVSFSGTTFAKAPGRFEAGTPAIVETIGLGAAIDYVNTVGRAAIAEHEAAMLDYLTAGLQTIPGLRLYGTAPEKAGVVSFTLEGVHAHDIGTIVDHSHSVAIRVGHHCAQPLMARLGVAATARASLGMYTNRSDIDILVASLDNVREMFA